MKDTFCDHGIAPGTPATLEAALAHTPPLVVIGRYEARTTNGRPNSGLHWVIPLSFGDDWPDGPHVRFGRCIESGPILNPPSDPEAMTGNFMFDVTNEVAVLRPCKRCGDTDPLGLARTLAEAKFRPDNFSMLHEAISADALAALRDARQRLQHEPHGRRIAPPTGSKTVGWSPFRCSHCAHLEKAPKGPFCTKCGTKNVPDG